MPRGGQQYAAGGILGKFVYPVFQFGWKEKHQFRRIVLHNQVTFDAGDGFGDIDQTTDGSRQQPADYTFSM